MAKSKAVDRIKNAVVTEKSGQLWQYKNYL